MSAPWPVKLAFKRTDKRLAVTFEDGSAVTIPYELLRVESPSAEVQGHGPGQKKLIAGKSDIDVLEAEPVGRYAVRLTFSDGHNSGIFSWSYLHELGENAEELLARYREQIKAAGA